MSTAPILLEHEFACGVHNGTSVRVSILNAAAAVLFCRGADEILIPTPATAIRSSVEAAVEELPEERRATVRLIDTTGSLLARVSDYVEPLRSYARKWPETAFINFAHAFIYHLALATQQKSAVAADSVQIVRGFVPGIDVAEFRGEGRYRLAEIINLIAAYEPIAAANGAITAPVIEQSMNNAVIEIIESAEFRRLTATAGVLGYLTNPSVALRKIKRIFTTILHQSRAHGALSIAAAASDIGAISPVAKGVAKIADLSATTQRAFAPPFLPLGSSEYGIYRVALAETYPGAVPPPGTIMVLESDLGAVSWFNEGEEPKLSVDINKQLKHRRKEAEECRTIQQRFFA